MEDLKDYLVLKPGETLVLFVRGGIPLNIREDTRKLFEERYPENHLVIFNAEQLEVVRVDPA